MGPWLHTWGKVVRSNLQTRHMEIEGSRSSAPFVVLFHEPCESEYTGCERPRSSTSRTIRGCPRTEHIGPSSRRVRASSCSRMSGRYISSTASAQRASHGHWVRLPRSALDSQTSSYDQAATRGSRWPVIARPLPSMGPARSDAALRRAWPGAGWISEIEDWAGSSVGMEHWSWVYFAT